jgi:hypothetical protein
MYADTKSPVGTRVLINISQREAAEHWIPGEVVGRSPKNTAHMEVRTKDGKLWDTHWGNTRIDLNRS